MNRPLIKEFATIGIVAPSSAQTLERIQRGVQKLEEMGYNIVWTESCTSTDILRLSGPDELRAQDVNALFAREDIDAIICVSGGYGSPRIVDHLDYPMIKLHPKPFVGFSDVTLLLNAITTRCKFPTYHGPMIVSDFANNRHTISIESFFHLATDLKPYEIGTPYTDEMQIIHSGLAEGELYGGNLSLLQVLAASEYCFDPINKILLIEDIYEENYRIDRMLQSLRLKGLFNGLKGVIIGGISGETIPQEGSFEMFSSFFKDATYPVVFNAPIGHVTPRFTVVIGAMTTIDTETRTITIR